MNYTTVWFNLLIILCCPFASLYSMEDKKPLKRNNSFYQEIIESDKHYDASKTSDVFIDRDEEKHLLINGHLLIHAIHPSASLSLEELLKIGPIKDFEGSMTTFEYINQTLLKITTETEDTQEKKLYFLNTTHVLEQTGNSRKTPTPAFIVHDNEQDALPNTFYSSKQAN